MWAIHGDEDLVWKWLQKTGGAPWGNMMHGGSAIDDAGFLHYGS